MLRWLSAARRLACSALVCAIATAWRPRFMHRLALSHRLANSVSHRIATSRAGIMPLYVPSLCLYPNVRYRYTDSPPPEGRTNVVLVHGYRPSPARGMSHVSVDAFLQPLRDQVSTHLLV